MSVCGGGMGGEGGCMCGEGGAQEKLCTLLKFTENLKLL